MDCTEASNLALNVDAVSAIFSASTKLRSLGTRIDSTSCRGWESSSYKAIFYMLHKTHIETKRHARRGETVQTPRWAVLKIKILEPK